MDISKDQSIKDAYTLLASNSSRKIDDLTPEFLEKVVEKLDNLLGYLNQGNVKSTLIEKVYQTTNRKMVKNFVRDFTFPAEIKNFRFPYFLLTPQEEKDRYKPGFLSPQKDIMSALYQKAIQSGLQPKMRDGTSIENFDMMNPEHFLGFIHSISLPTTTDSQIKQHFKDKVAGL